MSRCIRDCGLRNSRRGRVALPYCHITLKAQKPPSLHYPKSLNTIGQHVRKVRLDRGLHQKDIAAEMGVHPLTISNWEKGATGPELQFMPSIIRFLDYNPFPTPLDEPLTARLKEHRLQHGLSQKDVAELIKVDPSSIGKWELGKTNPSKVSIKKILRFLAR